MTYYAVTKDPNELMHFGIKGMKWGIIRTPEQLGHHKPPKSTKPRSPAYLKASAKLGRAMRMGIAKAQANWDAYNSPAAKAERTYKRNEKAFQKHLELARQGRLKYKGISDDEVMRITDRLNLERQSRALSGTEKQSFGRRMREAVGEGVIRGVGQGTAGYISERMTGRGRTTAEIKGARRKVRAQWTPAGLATRGLANLSDNMQEAHEQRKLDRANKHAAKRETFKENYKNEHSNKDRLDAESEYAALVEANRHMHYSRAVGNEKAMNTLDGYSIDRKEMKRLTTAQLEGRKKALENAQKLYLTNGETAIKAAKGARTVTTTDPDGTTREELVFDTSTQNNAPAQNNAPQRQDSRQPRGNNGQWDPGNNGTSYANARRIIAATQRYKDDTTYRAKQAQNAIDRSNAFINSLSDEELERLRQRNALRTMAIEPNKQARKQAQDEGYHFYDVRRQAREAEERELGAYPNMNLPTRTQVEAHKARQKQAEKEQKAQYFSSLPYKYDPNYGRHIGGTSSNRADVRVVTNPVGSGQQFSSSSSVTITRYPGKHTTRNGRGNRNGRGRI